ncbi:unnamed protein product, partial [Mesorhabditis belari]|uniref:Large ribosomal subunit protein mL50 n=1 Tax=Mesorhabditis belari TaxID=2138241 RepID=A0AAF3FGQ3_9BILA
MRRSTVCLVRGANSRGFFSKIFGGSEATSTSKETTATKMTKEEKEALRSRLSEVRTDVEKKNEAAIARTTTFSDDMLDERLDMDSIRARGVMKYRYTYNPPSNVKELVLSVVEKVTKSRDLNQTFPNNKVKFEILSKLLTNLKHSPTNSRLLHIKKASDVVEFYEEPVKNIDAYAQLARTENLPANLHVAEQPVRFHPEDKHAWHGGITAFPGGGGKVFGLRNKRILRQFNPKTEWYDYEEQNFDYSRPEKGMPWDPEISKKMDRYPDRRYSLSTKTFFKTQ